MIMQNQNITRKQNCVICSIVYIKTYDSYKEISEDVETRFDTSNYQLDRPLPKGKYKKVIGLMKDELKVCHQKKT